MSYYQFRLHVDHPGGGVTRASFGIVAPHQRRAFEPIDYVHDPRTAAMVGAPTPDQRKLLLSEREELARHIAEALTEHIMKAFAKYDTRDGYPISTRG